MMRNSKHFALGAATLLLSTAGFTACSSEDTFTGGSFSGESVKTQFAINIPVANSVNGRLSQDIVQGQNQPVFRGMDNIKLIPFTQQPGEGLTGNDVIGLGAILNDELAEETNAKVYYDVEIGQGVSHFLFYGEAKGSGDAKTNGALDANVTNVVNDITFKLKPISESAASDGQIATLTNALTSVATASGGGVEWKNSTSDLRNFYNSLIRLKAGSANSIKLALQDLKAGIETATATGETDLKSAIQTAIDGAVTSIKSCNYPRNLNLPDGAAQVKWNSATNQFDVVNEANIGNLSYTSLDKFVYPSSLYYWVNTPIKTSDTPLASQFEGKNNWKECTDLYKGSGTVEPTTSSVALENAIQYAVARLDVSARFNAETVKDNLQEDVTVSAGDSITLDGILVGGQKNLKWDFATAVDGTEYTIYDASITSTKLGSTNTGTIIAQSLALQSGTGTTVNFALELTNNTGAAFTGVDGIVPNGGRFYLVGKLVPEAGTANNLVFKQDYTTTAKVNITSLAHAYNCIPDLKNPKLELGLSVDLNWQAGLSQDVTIE